MSKKGHKKDKTLLNLLLIGGLAGVYFYTSAVQSQQQQYQYQYMQSPAGWFSSLVSSFLQNPKLIQNVNTKGTLF